jgi:hypothetical protein
MVELTDKEFAVVIACCTDAEKRMLDQLQELANKGNFRMAFQGKELAEALDSASEKLLYAFRNMPKTSE